MAAAAAVEIAAVFAAVEFVVAVACKAVLVDSVVAVVGMVTAEQTAANKMIADAHHDQYLHLRKEIALNL